MFNFKLAYRLLRYLIIAFTGSYLTLFTIIGLHAEKSLTSAPPAKHDAALILGNRIHVHGALNPCLTGRVDKGLSLAAQGTVSTLVMTGGRKNKNSNIEAEFMAAYAKQKGYKGTILIETKSRSTKENLELSAPILKAAHIHTIIIVSEPYHLWRTEKLVAAGHLGHGFDASLDANLNVSYAAAPSTCWVNRGMLSQGALREPLAVMHNFAKGYF